MVVEEAELVVEALRLRSARFGPRLTRRQASSPGRRDERTYRIGWLFDGPAAYGDRFAQSARSSSGPELVEGARGQHALGPNLELLE